MRLWLKTFFGIMAVVLGASTLWIWAAPLTGPEGRNVTFTEPNTIDAPMMKGNLLHLHNQTVDPTPVAGDLILYNKAGQLIGRDPAGNVKNYDALGGGGGAATTEKLPVQAASTANVTLSNPGTASFDGVTLTTGQRLLVWQQTTGSQNGIYLFATSSTALTRASDADTSGEFLDNFAVKVQSGTLYGGVTFYFANTGAFTLGTTTPTFAIQSWGAKAETLNNKNVANGYAGLTSAAKQIWTQRGDAATHTASAASGQIIPTASTMRVSGSGAAVTMTTGNPRILGCTTAADDGKELTIEGSHATNTLTMPTGQGVQLCGNTGSLIFGLNLGSAHFVCNGATAIWRQSNCPDLQQAFNVSNKILTGSTPATGLHIGNSPTNYCTTFWDAANGNQPTTQCYCGGALCPNSTVGPLPVGGSMRVLNNAGTPIFVVQEAGTVTGLSVPRQILMTAWYPALSGADCPATRYWSPVGTNASATKEDTYMVLTGSRTVRNLRFQALANLPTDEIRTVTVYKNGAASAVTCTVNGSGTVGTGEISNSTCADVTNSFGVVAGDTLTVFAGCSGSSTAPLPQAAVSFELE